MIVRRKHIRDLASRVLSESSISRPPVPVEKIVRDRGVALKKESVQNKVSGFLYRNASTNKAIIGVNKLHHLNRQRFTIAHELGHLLLHSGDDVHVDTSFTVKNRDDRSSEGTDVEEMEANLFAAELLVPAHFLLADLKKLGELDLADDEKVANLAEVYQVSSQAMAVRLSHLGFLHI